MIASALTMSDAVRPLNVYLQRQKNSILQRLPQNRTGWLQLKGIHIIAETLIKKHIRKWTLENLISE